ncbi:sensor histidine kinase [Chloroflexota bacterium]
MIALCLTAALPYLINVNLRQRLESEDILRERQRLSREIHDGTVQTTSALHWQAQLVYRRLAEMGIDLGEVTELARLAAKAYQDSRESMELLRNYTGDGSFLPHIRDYIEHLKQDNNIEFFIDVETGEFHLEAPVELQLLRICQEALTNIRKHSEAYNIEVKVKSVKNHVEVSIADDGIGFDVPAYYRDCAQTTSQGLAVMRERAESIGGGLKVLSMPGQGTEIQVQVPAKPRRGRLL